LGLIGRRTHLLGFKHQFAYRSRKGATISLTKQ
jgi:hypothetical protein